MFLFGLIKSDFLCSNYRPLETPRTNVRHELLWNVLFISRPKAEITFQPIEYLEPREFQ
jgi:hypothetical protein